MTSCLINRETNDVDANITYTVKRMTVTAALFKDDQLHVSNNMYTHMYIHTIHVHVYTCCVLQLGQSTCMFTRDTCTKAAYVNLQSVGYCLILTH